MSADIQLNNQGIAYPDGNIVTHAATYPASGSWTTGDIVLEQTSTTRLSGWKRITTGSGNVLGTDWVYCSNLISGTAQATTSGTSITFTGIPSWAKRVTAMLNAVGSSLTSTIQLQVGSGSIQSTGYAGLTSGTSNAPGATNVPGITSGFAVIQKGANADTAAGTIVLSLLGSNIWVASGVIYRSATPNSVSYAVSGQVTTSGALDRINLTTVNGTDTFNAGSINIMWE